MYLCATPHMSHHIITGVALGAHLGQAGVITDAMLMAAAETLPTLIPEEDLAKGIIYPRLAVGQAAGG